jgi:hypothetical protein
MLPLSMARGPDRPRGHYYSAGRLGGFFEPMRTNGCFAVTQHPKTACGEKIGEMTAIAVLSKDLNRSEVSALTTIQGEHLPLN